MLIASFESTVGRLTDKQVIIQKHLSINADFDLAVAAIDMSSIRFIKVCFNIQTLRPKASKSKTKLKSF